MYLRRYLIIQWPGKCLKLLSVADWRICCKQKKKTILHLNPLFLVAHSAISIFPFKFRLARLIHLLGYCSIRFVLVLL